MRLLFDTFPGYNPLALNSSSVVEMVGKMIELYFSDH